MTIINMFLALLREVAAEQGRSVPDTELQLRFMGLNTRCEDIIR